MAAWTQIASMVSPAAGYFDFQGLDLTPYEMIEIIASGVKVTSDGTKVFVTFYSAGPTLITSYDYENFILPDGGGLTDESNVGHTSVKLTFDGGSTYQVGNAADEFFSCKIQLGNPTASGFKRTCLFAGNFINPAGDGIHTDGGGFINDTAAITGFRLQGSSDLVSGKVAVLGMGTS